MRQIFFSLVFFFCVGFALSRFAPQLIPFFSKIQSQQERVLGIQLTPAPYPLEMRPFVLVVTARNQGAFLSKTLESIFSQKYENFRVIYIDDASNDGSFELARDLIYETRFLPQVTLVQNEEELGPLANLSRAVASCKEEEIIVVLNGEDRLAHEWVLSRLNQYYDDPDLWMTYSQYLEYPSFIEGKSAPYLESEWKESGLRSVPFRALHLKTFYASLFQKIKEEDLIYEGRMIPGLSEMAYMIPLLEMGKDHFAFIPEVLSLSIPRMEDPEWEGALFSYLREKRPYSSLTALFSRKTDGLDSQGAF